MVKVNVGGCNSFVKDAEYKKFVEKALDAFDVLQSETGAGNDFLGWKTLPVDTPESLISECEAVRDSWKAKGVNLVIVIGIGGSYLGAKCAIEALSHSFVEPATKVVFAGNNLSEDYLAELMDLVQKSNAACVVISKSGDKSVVVRGERRLPHPVYGKVVRQFKKYHCDDAKNECKVGDTVRIIECPPISKRKTWSVVNRNGTPMGDAVATADAASA